MNKVEAIIRPEKVDAVKNALDAKGFVGLNVVNVVGRGVQRGVAYVGRSGSKQAVDMLPKAKLELVVRDADTDKVVSTIVAAAQTGNIGDGKIFVFDLASATRIRTGETGDTAL